MTHFLSFYVNTYTFNWHHHQKKWQWIKDLLSRYPFTNASIISHNQFVLPWPASFSAFAVSRTVGRDRWELDTVKPKLSSNSSQMARPFKNLLGWTLNSCLLRSLFCHLVWARVQIFSLKGLILIQLKWSTAFLHHLCDIFLFRPKVCTPFHFKIDWSAELNCS